MSLWGHVRLHYKEKVQPIWGKNLPLDLIWIWILAVLLDLIWICEDGGFAHHWLTRYVPLGSKFTPAPVIINKALFFTLIIILPYFSLSKDNVLVLFSISSHIYCILSVFTCRALSCFLKIKELKKMSNQETKFFFSIRAVFYIDLG